MNAQNPFVDSEFRVSRPKPTTIVIFGATGDLTKRKLIPALANLFHDDYLPENVKIIGVSRSPLTDDEFRDRLHAGLSQFSRREIKDEIWKAFAKNLHYHSLQFDSHTDFMALKAKIDKLSGNPDSNCIFYLATAPEFFGTISSSLKKAGLIEDLESKKKTNVVFEKPFGHDLASAKELNRTLRHNLAEEQIYRIDHYLGKETVQNILVFRFANGIFEPLWNHKYIDHIQISVCEDIGVGSRAGYFDQSGILRDIVQNHLLQMLALLCIEPPISLNNPESIRDEKVKVLKSLRRFTPEQVATKTVRAQYTSGFVNGSQVTGYLDEAGVAKDSKTETFAAMTLEIDNWRWAGVPIYIRSGKRLPRRITELTIHFKNVPHSLFRGKNSIAIEQNVLSIQVQPQEGIQLRINSKPPGPRVDVRPVDMDFRYNQSFGIPSPEAYERLLLDAMKGDPTLFTRDDEIEEAWDFLAPVFSSWSSAEAPPLYTYEAGTWGPQSAASLLRLGGHRWRRL